MGIMPILRSPKTAVIFMAFLVAFALVLGYRHFGWLGVSFVGILGLAISFRAEVFEDYFDPHERNAGQVVDMYKRQMDNRRQDGAEAKLKREAHEMRLYATHRAINAIFGALTVLGGAMSLKIYFLE